GVDRRVRVRGAAEAGPMSTVQPGQSVGPMEAAEPAPALIAVGVDGLPEVTPGADLGDLALGALAELVWPDGSRGTADGDVVVVTSKIVSKAEGRVVAATDR